MFLSFRTYYIYRGMYGLNKLTTVLIIALTLALKLLQNTWINYSTHSNSLHTTHRHTNRRKFMFQKISCFWAFLKRWSHFFKLGKLRFTGIMWGILTASYNKTVHNSSSIYNYTTCELFEMPFQFCIGNSSKSDIWLCDSRNHWMNVRNSSY